MVDVTGGPCPPLLVFADDWGRHPSSCQHLIRHLLGRHEVIWVDTIGTRPPRLDRVTLRRGVEKFRHWARPTSGPILGGPRSGPRVLGPAMWPWFRTAFDRRLNRELLLRHLNPILEPLHAPPVAVTTLPIVADLAGALPVARWVYYCVDDFGSWPGLDGSALRRMEKDLVRRVDVLVAASEALQGHLDRLGRRSHLLTHGVDLDHWTAVGNDGEFPGLAGVPGPLIIFWGVIDRRLDPRYLARLAADLTGGTILLVGPELNPDPALSGIPRLVRLPPVPYEQLPLLARRAAVLVMPYADLPVTRAMQPLKLKEYLATGLPVVVADLPATRPWDDCLDLAGTPALFSEAVRSRLAGGLPDNQRAARARLGCEGWAAKAREFGRLIAKEEATVDATTLA